MVESLSRPSTQCFYKLNIYNPFFFFPCSTTSSLVHRCDRRFPRTAPDIELVGVRVRLWSWSDCSSWVPVPPLSSRVWETVGRRENSTRKTARTVDVLRHHTNCGYPRTTGDQDLSKVLVNVIPGPL